MPLNLDPHSCPMLLLLLEGHGTHVSGSVAGNSMGDFGEMDGMAPDAKITFFDIGKKMDRYYLSFFLSFRLSFCTSISFC